MDPLQRLTAMSAEEFAVQHWATTPLLRRAADLPGDGFADLLDLAGVDEIVSRRGLRTPFLRMARDGAVRGTGRYTRSGGAGADVGDQAADDRVLAELAGGSTLVLQGLHRLWPPLIDFAGDLTRALGHPTQVNAYLTPPQNTGFDPHYDVHDVFVLQIAGRKHWRIHAPVLTSPLRDQPWQDRREAVAAAAAGPPYLETELAPGDVLYLPRGWIHAATALGELSGHLTLGVQPVTRALLARQVLDRLADDEDLRRSLPAGVDLADPSVLADDAAATRAALHAAVDRLDDVDLAAALGRHLTTSTRPAPLAPLAQLDLASRLTADDRLRLRPGLRCRLVDAEKPDVVELRLPEATLALPADVADAVAHLIARSGDAGGEEGVAVRDLPGLDDADAVTLSRRLLREGVLVPGPEPDPAR